MIISRKQEQLINHKTCCCFSPCLWGFNRLRGNQLPFQMAKAVWGWEDLGNHCFPEKVKVRGACQQWLPQGACCAVPCWDEGDAATGAVLPSQLLTHFCSCTWAGGMCSPLPSCSYGVWGELCLPEEHSHSFSMDSCWWALSKALIIRTCPTVLRFVSLICWKTVCSKGKVGWHLSGFHCVHAPAEGGNPDVAEAVIAVSGNRNCTVIYDDLILPIISSEDQKARDGFCYWTCLKW